MTKNLSKKTIIAIAAAALILIGAVAAGLAGFLIGIPVLRLRGDYLAIVTLAFGEIIKNVINAIQNGTPLPKGHGRLIAEPTETDISNTVGGDNDFAECIRDSVKAVFDNAKTIIEADKE